MSDEEKEVKDNKVEDKSDWDFDFSQYEQEDKSEEVVESIVNLKRPIVTGVRSRFSNGQAELERLAEINRSIGMMAIKVASRTQKINELWEFYGLLDEFWESIRNIYGSHINGEINGIKKKCRILLSKNYKNGTIPSTVHNHLLHLRSLIYRLKQLGNLGFEVEKMFNSSFSKAKRKIVE